MSYGKIGHPVDHGKDISLDSPAIQMYSASANEEHLMKNSNGQTPEIGKLSAQVQEISKRLMNLEETFHKWSPFINRLSDEGLVESDELQFPKRDHCISEAGKTALAVLDHNLITSKPRNESIVKQFLNCIMVIKRYNFAVLQCLLIFVAAGALLTFGALKFLEAHDSVRGPYKPYKVDGRDEYYRNKELKYELPIHYFWLDLGVYETNFYPIYRDTFNETCDTTLKDCLNRYINNFFNSTFAMTGLHKPYYFNDYDYDTSSYLDPETVEFTDNGTVFNGEQSPHCFMTTMSNGTVTTEMVGLQNFTLHLDEIGVDLQNSSDVTDTLGLLVRLEFNNFAGYMSGKVMCDIKLDMYSLNSAFSEFATFEILFMVSREEFSSGKTGITEYIRSMKKVTRKHEVMIDQVYSYMFEEHTYDGESEFTAEVHLVDNFDEYDAVLNIQVYPFPTVTHYVSFDRYSYLDWLADFGGIYALVLGFFFILVSRIIKLANCGQTFHLQQGILPIFSLSHRNAEELSGLRSLVMASLGITEQDYFSKKMEKRQLCVKATEELGEIRQARLESSE